MSWKKHPHRRKYSVPKDRDFHKMIKANGFVVVRKTGDHIIYERNGKHMSVPVRVNPMVARRLCKENNLKEVV